MSLHGVLSAAICKAKHRPVKLKNIQSVCILMCILTFPQIAHAAKFEYKAVFSAPCSGLMTLSTPVPELTQFTVCTYIKLASSNPWTAFTYHLPASPNVYEIGVLGDSSSLKIWMFGNEINVIESLNLHTWYEICIVWNSKDESMGFYLDGILKVNRKLENETKVVGGGSLVLGCSHFKETNATVSVGLVGEMYMFRMWNTAQRSHFQNCNDGNVVKWKIADWIYYSNLVQQDSSLYCAKEQVDALSPGQINNIIHMLHKRSADNGSESSSTKSPTTAAKPLTSGFTTLSSAEGTNTTNSTGFSIVTSESGILWSQNINVSNGNNTISTTRTFSSSSVTTNLDNERSSWSNAVTSQQQYLTSEMSQITDVSVTETFTFPSSSVTAGSVNCTSNETNAFQMLQATTCNATCSNSSAYQVILKGNCPVVNSVLKTGKYNYTVMDSCTFLVFEVDDSVICSLWSKLSSVVKDNIQSINKIGFFCCCSGNCSFLNCSISAFSCTSTGGSGGSGGNGAAITQGFQSSTYSSTGYITDKNESSVTVYSGSSVISTKEFSSTSNGGSSITVSNTTSKNTSTSNNETNTTVNGSTTGGTTRKPNESSTSVSHGTTGTTGTISNSTTISSSKPTINNESNVTNSGHTGNSTHGTTVTTGPVSTSYSGSETTYGNNSVTITSSSPNYTIIFPNNTGDFNNANGTLSLLEDLLSGPVNTEEAKKLLGVLDSFLDFPQATLGPLSNRLIKVVDKIGLQLTFKEENISINSQSLALAVNKVNASSFTGTSFGVDSSSGLQVSLGSQALPNSDASVLLPASLLKDLSPGDIKDASRVQFNYYAKTSFFQDSFLNGKQLVSKVISSSVANLSVTNLSENITVTLKTSSMNEANGMECVFWDFSKNSGSGGWSSYGCLVANTTQNQTVCKCNHLTSFAILMNVSPNEQLSPKDLLVLTFITYIGCGLSAMFLSVTLVTYIAFEKIRRDYPSKILIQLCAALVCLNLTFLLNPWIALYNDIPGLCISVAAFLHYFVLVSITWMGLEAFHMYLSLVKVFNTYVRKYMLKFCVVGWGVPAVVVAIILAVNKDLYSLKISGTYPNGSADYFCWVNDVVFWVTIVGYFGIIFLLNVSMFVVVLIQLCRIKRQKQLGYQRKTTFQDLRSVAGITFLLGITWGLGFFAFGPGRTAIMYLFTIFNTLQGFFIFFFYCVAKENVRKQWRRYLCCGRFRLAENSDWSKTATNKLRKQTSKQGPSSSSSNSIQSTSHTNSSTLLVANEYSLHPNGNGNVYKEKNGVTFMPQNGEMPLQEFAGRPSTNNGDVQQNSLRRTSKRGSVHFIDEI